MKMLYLQVDLVNEIKIDDYLVNLFPYNSIVIHKDLDARAVHLLGLLDMQKEG